jgi:type III secretion system low calcium response chaperone LcrH/SycD
MGKQVEVSKEEDVVTPVWGNIKDEVAPIVPAEIPQDIHAYVYDFYQRGALKQAEALFRLLCIYDFYNADFLMGMAMVFQLKAQYAQACEVYAIAFSIASDDYRSVFHSGHCYLALLEWTDARRCFERVVAHSTDVRLVQRASLALESMPLPSPFWGQRSEPPAAAGDSD